jgi:hypothetical protein
MILLHLRKIHGDFGFATFRLVACRVLAAPTRSEQELRNLAPE